MASIQTRTNPSGAKRYIARVHHKGRHRSKSFATHAEAEDWLRTHAPARSQKWDRSLDRIPLGKWVDTWAERAERNGTRIGREHLAENLSDLRYMRMGAIEPIDIRDWLTELEEGRPWAEGKPLARSTILTLLGHLSSAYNTAIREGAMMTNPCTNLRVRRGTSKTVSPSELITTKTIKALTAKAYPPVDDMIRVAATTGLRPAELAGLTPRNLNLDRRELYVVQQAVGRGRDMTFGPLKSEAGRRTIPLPDSTVTVLRKHVNDDEPDLPVFRSEQGIMWTSSNMGRTMRLICEDANVKATWKSLRHYYASVLIDSGATVATVQKRMGHASAMVTLNVYTHLLPHEDEKTRSAFDGLF